MPAVGAPPEIFWANAHRLSPQADPAMGGTTTRRDDLKHGTDAA
jgi:hypothetical protein